MDFDGAALDRYITGNYGEDQFADECGYEEFFEREALDYCVTKCQHYSEGVRYDSEHAPAFVSLPWCKLHDCEAPYGDCEILYNQFVSQVQQYEDEDWYGGGE